MSIEDEIEEFSQYFRETRPAIDSLANIRGLQRKEGESDEQLMERIEKHEDYIKDLLNDHRTKG